MQTGRVQKLAPRQPFTALAFLAVVLAALATPPGQAHAQTLERRIEQYQHTRWTAADGAPAVVVDIKQSPDGFIWLGSQEGLVRFDGLSFEQISPLTGDLSGPVSAVMVSRTGEVWVWILNAQRLAVFRNGRLVPVSEPQEGHVVRLMEAPDGAVWAGAGNVGLPLYRFKAGRWSHIDATAGLPRSGLTDLVATVDGAIWASYVDYVLRQAPGGGAFERVPDAQATTGRIAVDRTGRVWLLDSGAARPISGPGASLPGPGRNGELPADDTGRPGRPLFDRLGNLWEATRGGLTRAAPSAAPGPGPGRSLDRFTAVQGLSSDETWALLEDREGNIWVGTVNGLDRFRRSALVPEPGLRKPGRYGNVQLAASDGTVYIAEAHTLYSVPPGRPPQVRLTGIGYPEGICEGRDGTIWLASGDAIRGVRQGRPTIVLARPPQAQRDLADCVDDVAGGFQVTAGNDGVLRRTPEGWEPLSSVAGSPVHARAIVRDGRGRLWANLDRNALGLWTREGWREVLARERSTTDTVVTLFPLPSGVVFAGRDGAGRYSPETGAAGPVRAFRESSGLVYARDGDVWGFSRHGLIRMDARAFARSLADPDYDAPVRIFDASDGLRGRHANQSWRSLVQGGDGRLWLATATGTAWIDPAQVPINRLPPSIVITNLEVRDRVQRDPATVTLDAGTSSLAISFSVLNLGAPERVQVRYRLVGLDQDWVDPGQRRQAFFTNLGPGQYRFEVIAANEDGVWNRKGASLSLTIPPTFLQSIWFKFLCGLGILGLVSAAYLLRVRQVTAELRDRFQVRIAERERIARELHDTWLQGVQALVLSFQSVANRLPAGSDLRESVATTLDRADSLMVDGRRRLRDLRRDAADADLGQALADSARDLISGQSEARVTIEGAPRPLDPTVAEELLRVAEEAIRNAVQHGEDVQIEVALAYVRRELRLAVRDDGPGLPADVLETKQRSGHYGLLGMQERVRRIGGRLEISSRLRRGAEVAVTVPARKAYRDGQTSLPRWLLRLVGRGQPD